MALPGALRRFAQCLLEARGRRHAGARTPRYHPACHARAWPLDLGCDGPTRSVLLGRIGLFFRRLPGDGRIGAVGSILRSEANRFGRAPRGYL